MFLKKCLIIICLCASVQLFAQNASDAIRLAMPGYSTQARALGMGNSFISISDDASGLSFNPAGLGLVKKMELAGGFNYNMLNNKSSYYGTTTESDNTETSLNQAAFIFPFPTVRGSLVFGVGYNQSKDLGSLKEFTGFNYGNTSRIQDLDSIGLIPYRLGLSDAYPTRISGQLQQSGTTTETGSLNNWDFSGAMEISKNLFLGVKLGIFSGTYSSSKTYTEEDFKNIYSGVLLDSSDSKTNHFRSFNLNTDLNWDITGYTMKFGLLYQLKTFGRFGMTVELPKTYSIKETFSTKAQSNFNTASYSLAPYDYPDYTSEYDIVTPFVFSAGGSANIAGLIASADVHLMDYSQTKFKNPGGSISQSDLSDINRSIKTSLRAVANFNLGLEYTIPDVGLRLRAGYFTQKSPYKNDPPEFDRKYITAGAGFIIEDALSLDFAYVHGYWKDYEDNYNSTESRVFQEITNNNIVVSFNYRF